MTSLQKRLFELQDIKYRDFHSKLIPNIDKERVIGIRTPMLRRFAKEFGKKTEAEDFLAELPHDYYEENNLHMMLLAQEKDFQRCLEQIESFLPYIDNWATCDLPLPKCFAKHKEELLGHIRIWIASGETYTIRYGMGVLVAGVVSDEYYVNMMIAWYLATALARQWDTVIPYLEESRLSPWLHRKTIQKAVESYRITPEQKVYLRKLR